MEKKKIPWNKIFYKEIKLICVKFLLNMEKKKEEQNIKLY